MTQHIKYRIWHEAELFLDSGLRGMDSYRTHTLTLRFQGFEGKSTKNRDLTPNDVAVMMEAASSKLIQAIEDKALQVQGLLAGERSE